MGDKGVKNEIKEEGPEYEGEIHLSSYKRGKWGYPGGRGVILRLGTSGEGTPEVSRDTSLRGSQETRWEDQGKGGRIF